MRASGVARRAPRRLHACKKSLYNAAFLQIKKRASASCSMRARSSDTARSMRVCHVTADRRSYFGAWRIRCFFRCAVVINVQCSSIRDCAASLSPVSSWLGGQNGEEGKVEDEVRRQENGAQNREAEDRWSQEEDGLTPRASSHTKAHSVGGVAKRWAVPPQTPRRLKSTKETSAKWRGSLFAGPLSTGRNGWSQALAGFVADRRQRTQGEAQKRRGDPAKDVTTDAVRCRDGGDLRTGFDPRTARRRLPPATPTKAQAGGQAPPRGGPGGRSPDRSIGARPHQISPCMPCPHFGTRCGLPSVCMRST